MHKVAMADLSLVEAAEVNGGGVAKLVGIEVGEMIAAVEDFVEEGIRGIINIGLTGSPH